MLIGNKDCKERLAPLFKLFIDEEGAFLLSHKSVLSDNGAPPGPRFTGGGGGGGCGRGGRDGCPLGELGCAADFEP